MKSAKHGLLCLLIFIFGLNGGMVFGQDILVYGTTERITDMDPAFAYDFHTVEIFNNIYQGLMGYPAGQTNLVPHLAESYQVVDQGLGYIFRLKSNLKFSDGTPLDAAAVKWSIDRVIRLKGPPSWLVTDFVKSVDVLNPSTVKFNLKNPVAYFPSLVATVPYYPVNPNIYPADRAVTDPKELKGGKLVGLGAYSVISFKRDQEIILDANPEYWGSRPKNDRIVIRYFADATTMRLALEKGELDFAFKSFNPSDVSDLIKSKTIKTITGQGPYIRYLVFQCGKHLTDPVLRKGVAAAIDRPAIIAKVYLGQNIPLYSMVPQGMWSHSDEFKSRLGDGNIELSRELLSRKGYDRNNKLKIDLWYTPSHYGDTEVDLAAALKKQFEATGVIEVTVHSADWATYKQNWREQVMPVYLLGWYPDYIDPDNYTASFGSTAGSRGNGAYFSNRQWDQLLSRAQKTADHKLREDIYREIQRMWTDQVPTAPIFQGSLYLFAQNNIRGIKISPTLQLIYSAIFRGK